MEIRNNTSLYQSRPTFQAKVDPKLITKLETEAKSPNVLKAIRNKIKLIEANGDKSTVIGTCTDLETKVDELYLFNKELSVSYGERLPQNGTLVASFLSLTNAHILNAKQNIKKTVFNNKCKLFTKAMESNSLFKKIVRRKRYKDKAQILANTIDQFREKTVIKFLFNLDKEPNTEKKLLDFAV